MVGLTCKMRFRGDGMGRTRKHCKPCFILFSQWKIGKNNNGTVFCPPPLWMYSTSLPVFNIFSKLWFISWYYSSVYEPFHFVGNHLHFGKCVLRVRSFIFKLRLRNGQLLLCPCPQSHISTCCRLCRDLLVKTQGGFIWNVSKEKKNLKGGKWVTGGFFNYLFYVEIFLSLLTMMADNDVLHLKLLFPAEISVFPNASVKQHFLFSNITAIFSFVFA